MASPITNGAVGAQLADQRLDADTNLEATVSTVAQGALTSNPESESPVSVCGAARKMARAQSLEEWIDVFFVKAATIGDFQDGLGDLHESNLMEGYEERRAAAEQRLIEIQQELDGQPSKTRRSKLNQQYKGWHSKYTQCDFLLDLYSKVVDYPSHPKSYERVEELLLPQLLRRKVQLASEHHPVLADLCSLYLKSKDVTPHQAYQVLLGLPVSQDDEHANRIGQLLRWAAKHLAWNGHYEYAAQLFERSRDHISVEREIGFSKALRLGSSLGLTFMHSGMILGCSTKESALAAIARMKQVLTGYEYRRGFKLALEGSVHVMGMLHDDIESDEDDETVKLVSVTDEDRAAAERILELDELGIELD